MKICVFGLWHLGCVTAACVAEHYEVTGLDPDKGTVDGLQKGKPPIFEPGLSELIESGVSKGTLKITTDIREAVSAAQVVWVAFDTPVNEADEADFGYVETQIATLFPYLGENVIVLISSQIPVGTTSRVESNYRSKYPAGTARFAYTPENLRLGKALDVFRNPGRIVVGVRAQAERDQLAAFLAPFCSNLIWMSVESAEMTKHAVNAFLADSIVFMNELATLCELAGADAKQVEQGLKTEDRIGPRAYLSPGGAFAGGTLARDISFLARQAEQFGVRTPLLASIQESNEFHKTWPRRKLESVLGSLAGKTIALLGLTYKPGTDTLRRSSAIELARWLGSRQANVRAFDPAIKSLPREMELRVSLCDSALDAVQDCDAVVITTEWPVFREMRAEDLTLRMKTPIVVDANRFLEKHLKISPPLRYIAVGKPKEAL